MASRRAGMLSHGFGNGHSAKRSNPGLDRQSSKPARASGCDRGFQSRYPSMCKSVCRRWKAARSKGAATGLRSLLPLATAGPSNLLSSATMRAREAGCLPEAQPMESNFSDRAERFTVLRCYAPIRVPEYDTRSWCKLRLRFLRFHGHRQAARIHPSVRNEYSQTCLPNSRRDLCGRRCHPFGKPAASEHSRR